MLGGALAGFLVGQLGFLDLVGWETAWFVLSAAMLGAIAGSLGATRLVVAVASAFIVAYAAVALTPIVSGPAAAWVRSDVGLTGSADAVVVLSSGLVSDTTLDVAGTERLLTGLAVLGSTSTHRLVTTRIRQSVGGHPVSSDRAQGRLIGLSALAPEWLIADSVTSTRDEAVRTAARLLPIDARRIILVTSPVHARRACATFEAVGFTVFCLPAAEIDGNVWSPRGAGDRLGAARAYLRERLAVIKYRRKGWVGALGR